MNVPIPEFCEHNAGGFDSHVRCMRSGHVVWTECTSWHFGESPRCSFVEPDNSERACRRRLEHLEKAE